ncbi:MerR family transcriptional regulator [Paenibacillus rhizosphaerae]|uniref:MerR family transcriptional regulator n=1 Tax=Paenibacillus rhizosphaerae TaxID=297318 RepID=A0A1R1F067_9BACL|nr:MerR family transcriptional regulator [Paenibacillus sp. SSG-1]OMF57447.1 MerR family transcriptional regulator [Paenibacillus rhizosphaerae]OXL83876.1 MerR family transcriptional regulator [Paenibacillus sp. SSG-1]UYO02577.1 MerR family transcriptional regulator [Paenibacillus sp. PSB04]
MKIGKVRKITGVSARSIRYYEEKGLIKTSRQENNYREYDEKTIESINTIQLYLGLGLTTDQIRDIIFCRFPEQQEHKEKDVYCEELLLMYQSKMHEIDQQLDALTKAKFNLAEKIDQMVQKREEDNK